MKVGYARVSKHEQNLDSQLDALKKAECDKIFTDKSTGVKFDRKGLNDTLVYMRGGDTLVVWKLDRVGRSLKDLIDIITKLHEMGINFVSLTENIDTTTPGGILIFNVMGALAQFERDLIRERTNVGLAAAKARGRLGGHPRKLNAAKVRQLLELYENNHPIDEICATLKIGRSTFYRYVNESKRERDKVV